jgi:hypothetical protein
MITDQLQIGVKIEDLDSGQLRQEFLTLVESSIERHRVIMNWVNTLSFVEAVFKPNEFRKYLLDAIAFFDQNSDIIGD